MILAYAVLIGLAVYRAWRITAEDTIAEPLRDWLYADAGPVRGFFADLNACVWCLGFWYSCAGAWLVSDIEAYNAAQLSILWLAASVVAGITRVIVDSLTP